MFKFKKKPLIQSSELLKLRKSEDLQGYYYNIIISPYLQDLQKMIKLVLQHYGIYDDKIWVEAYKEYHKNYQVYDKVPELLLYRVPTLFNKAYPKFSYQDDIDTFFKYFIPYAEVYEYLPEVFKLDQDIESSLVRFYSQLYEYLNPETRVSVEKYTDFIRSMYCKNWNTILTNPDKIKPYFEICIKFIYPFLPKENEHIFKNLLERWFEKLYTEIIEKPKETQNNE